MKETTKTEVSNPFAKFAAERVGINPMSIEEGETIYIKVVSAKVATRQLKTQKKPTPFIDVINAQTGEEGTFWLSGSLNYQFNELQATESLEGRNFGITHLGKKDAVINGEKAQVNQYEVIEYRENN
jgi:hypothetical protein